MRKVLLIIGICIIWSNTLCAQITVSPRTEKMELVNLLHKKRNPYSLYQKRDSIRLARFEHRRNVESYLKSRELRKETVKIDIASCAKQLRSSGITSKIVNETTAGTLSSYFTDEEKSSISSLTITGKMDARDFKFVRDNFNYRLLDLDISGVTIEEYTGTGGTDTVGRYKTYPANTIPRYSFWNAETHRVTELSSIVLPSTITTIGEVAFLGQDFLSTITIPSSVTTIKYYAFTKCLFTSIVIPSSVVELEAGVFSYNTELRTASIASSTTGLGTFENDSLLSSVIFEPTVKKIETWTFENCDSLSTIEIPSTVNYIENDAFADCDNLKSAVIAADTIGWDAFRDNYITSLILTDDVSSIEMSAFSDSKDLTSVTIPSSVTDIGAFVFRNCQKLVSAKILSRNTGHGTFSHDSLLSSVTFGSNVQEIGEESFEYCIGITSISISGTISTIHDEAFSHDSLLSSVTFGNNVQEIGEYAFESCIGLTSISIPGTISKIHDGAFNESGLTSVILNEGTKSIGEVVFENTHLSSITIPASIDSIGVGAFCNTQGKSMSIIVSPDNACYSSDHGILFNKDQTKLVYYPAFEKCYIIPGTVKTVGCGAFCCDATNSIIVPASVTSLEPGAFVGILDTCSIIFNPSSTLREISDEAFCLAGITAVNIPSTVKTIGTAAFGLCPFLKSITIPASVDTIKPLAFVGCDSLRSIYSYAVTPPILRNTSALLFFDEVDTISYPVFGCNLNELDFEVDFDIDATNCVQEAVAKEFLAGGWLGVDTTTCILHVPFGSKRLYQKADQWKSFTHIEEDLPSGITSKIVNETTAGTLSSYFTDEEKRSISSLTVIGKMDARDFKFIRDSLYNNLNLDISGINIEEYTGTAGTDTVGVNKTYPANTIPQYSFWNSETNCVTELSSIILPSSITTIGDYSFLGQKYLSTITIPSSVTTIQYHAFEQCSFTSIIIPLSVNSIKGWAFYNCTNLKTAVIAAGKIGESAFENNYLTSLTLTDNVFCIEKNAFSNSKNLVSVTIPGSVTDIGDCVFSSCQKLNSVTILCKKTGDNTFFEDPLSYVIFGDKVKEIGKFAFEDCIDLTSISIPESIERIGAGAFMESGLTSIILNQKIKSIEGEMFRYTNLSSITIPVSIDTIKPLVFAECHSLETIYSYPVIPPVLSDTSIISFFNEVDTLAGPVFGYYDDDDKWCGVDTMTCVLHVPSGSKILYQTADQWKSFTHIEEDLPSGINSIDAPTFSIYFNPATKEFTVLGLKGKGKLMLADSSGRIVMQKYVIPDQHISVAGLTKGLYLANIDGETIKFIIK